MAARALSHTYRKATHSVRSFTGHRNDLIRYETILCFVSCTLLLVGLAGCAGSIAPPTVVTELPSDQRASLHLASVTTDAAQGVAMTPDDLNNLTQQVIAEIKASSPAMLDESAPQAKLMKITITRYDEGNAAARFMLAGLGQIYIEGDVALIDPQSLQVVARYKVAKDFSFGGIYGGTTTIHDVAKGFARSVAEVVGPKT